MGTFDVFAHPFGVRVYRNSVQDGFDDDGIWSTTEITPDEITGHLTPYTSRDSAESSIQETQLGAIETGMFRFFTAATPPFTKGDIIEVDQDLAGSVKFRYEVKARVRSQHLVGRFLGQPPRYEYAVLESPR